MPILHTPPTHVHNHDQWGKNAKDEQSKTKKTQLLVSDPAPINVTASSASDFFEGRSSNLDGARRWW